MPVRMAQRKNRTKTVTIDFEGEACDVTYRPGAVTPRFMREFQHADGDLEHDRLTTAIQHSVVSWDVLDEHEQQIPPTPEYTSEFDLGFLNAVLLGMIRDMNPTPTTGDASSAG